MAGRFLIIPMFGSSFALLQQAGERPLEYSTLTRSVRPLVWSGQFLKGEFRVGHRLDSTKLAATRSVPPQDGFGSRAAGLLLTLAMTGCGVTAGPTSDTAPTPKTGGTPTGQYNITVTGTTGSGASAITETLTLILVVT
jgi:hypothetical protein